MRQNLLWAAVAVGSKFGIVSAKPRLAFQPDGTFHLSIFEDLHYGEGEDNPPSLGWGPISDIKSTRVMNTILDSEEPDYVVLNGDLITGENTYLFNSTDYLDIIVKPLVDRSIPWSSTYGNHDINYNLSTEALLHKEQTRYGKLSLTRSMVSAANAGVSNYYLPVYSSKGYSSTPAALLWFFDSKGGKAFQKLDADGNQIQLPGTVDQSVVDWFTSTRDRISKKYKKTIPSLAFVHIPTYASAAAQLTASGINNHTAPGINDDCCPAATQGIDNAGEYDGSDVPFMQALLDTEGLIAVFSGHDHGNDWCYKWNSTLNGMGLEGDGLVVCFGRHSGYGGYGSWTRGARQVRLSEKLIKKGEAETWVRLEDETVSGWVMLNSTYGTDKYPAVNDTMTH
ncbi:Metallo-dependent phosphatase [Rhizodiscina lignyota]|uniref:Metallo-dependent phosphatase n=1 Tax=Rhizodiscina lignyota TaxID=1504668 RepID=A0A9P4MAR4_9PEZI|nr:Metallo-dependent phosphatase [Rhizodiscina lignyota]